MKRRLTLCGSLLFGTLFLFTMVLYACADNQDATPTPTPAPTMAPTPTPTPSMEQQASAILDGPIIVNGDRTGMTIQSGVLTVHYSILSNPVFVVKHNCFEVQKALWTSAIARRLTTVTVILNTDTTDAYGNTSTIIAGSCTLSAATEHLFHWDNMDYQDAWDNQVYDAQNIDPGLSDS